MSNDFNEKVNVVDGELWVKATDAGGQILSDPYQIFRRPEPVRRLNEQLPAASGHIFLGANLVVDLGRQSLAYLVGGKDYTTSTATNNWIITNGSWGTHDEVPRFTDASLSPQAATGIVAGANEIEYLPGLKRKPVFSVDWPQPFIVRFEIVLEANEGNGYLLREMGLWCQNGTLFARKVYPAIEKQSSFALSFLWKLRM